VRIAVRARLHYLPSRDGEASHEQFWREAMPCRFCGFALKQGREQAARSRFSTQRRRERQDARGFSNRARP